MQYLVYVVAYLSSLAQALVFPAMLLLAINQFNAKNFHLGLLAACGSGVYTLVALSSGHISERLPIRMQLATSSFILAISYYVMFSAPSFAVLLLLNTLNGVCTGLLWAPIEGVLSRLSKPARMRRNVGRYNLSWSLGMATGFFLYSYLTQMAFYAGSALIFVTAVILLFLRAPDAGQHPSGTECKGAERKDDPHHRFFLLIAWSALFTTYVGVAAVRQLFPKLSTELHISASVMGRIYAVGLVGQTIVMAAMGRFQRWHYKRAPFYVGEVGLALGALLIAVSRAPDMLAVGHFVVGASMAVLYSCSLYYSMQYSARAHHNTSVHEAVIGTAAMTPVLVGYIADRWHFTPLSYHIAAVVSLISLGGHLVLFGRRKKPLL